ncbi:MAG: tetratricopeptide repeat protein, partial [Caldilineaceae bacterium]|nr:tetratricopeptide repeat protein [Caldilineaceae bacterium]
EQYLNRLLAFTKDPDLLLRTYLELATKYAEIAAWEQAEHYFGLVDELAAQSSDPQFYVFAVESPIHIRTLHFRGDYKAYIDRLSALLMWLDGLPDHAFASDASQRELRRRVLSSLGMAAMRYGDYGLAIATAHQALTMFDAKVRDPQRGWLLLDLALAEQFAGLYPEAVAHNQEALAMVEASGAIDDIGLLQANLCLTLRQGGDLWEALRYGQAGIEALASVGLTRMEGQARNRVGHTLLAMARWQEAAVAYAEALAIWEPLHHPNRYEAVAGQAVALDHLGRSSEALELVRDVLAFVAREGLGGIVEPVLLLLHCEAVLTGGGDTAAARRVLHQAATWIETIAARISEDQVRAVFLTKPDHQRLAQRRKLYP